MTTVRNDVFKIGDNFATLLGDEVKVGQAAPEFTSVIPGWAPVNPLQESKGKVIILSAVPSLDTDVCDRETRRFNEEASKLGAQDMRQKAAELFVRASNNRDSEEKRKLLLSSRDLLQSILVKYPQSGLTDKVQRNLTRIEAELKAVDAGAGPRPATSGGAYVPPKTSVPPATTL